MATQSISEQMQDFYRIRILNMRRAIHIAQWLNSYGNLQEAMVIVRDAPDSWRNVKRLKALWEYLQSLHIPYGYDREALCALSGWLMNAEYGSASVPVYPATVGNGTVQHLLKFPYNVTLLKRRIQELSAETVALRRTIVELQAEQLETEISAAVGD